MRHSSSFDVTRAGHNLVVRVLSGLHTDPGEPLDSMNRIENLAKRIGEQIFYSHDRDEYATDRKAPEYYGGD